MGLIASHFETSLTKRVKHPSVKQPTGAEEELPQRNNPDLRLRLLPLLLSLFVHRFILIVFPLYLPITGVLAIHIHETKEE
jgi:hypothetical protein